MDLITMARNLGKQIQLEQEYKNFVATKEITENDAELQNMIGEFNLLRAQMSEEMSNAVKNEKKTEELNTKLVKIHGEIVKNPLMADYNKAREEADGMMEKVNLILSASVSGENPETVDVNPPKGGCSAGCSGCSSDCH